MMRWVFAALVLANLGLLMWASWYRESAEGALPARPVLRPELMVPITTPGVALRTRRSERVEPPLAPTKAKRRCVTLGPVPAGAAEPAAARLTADGIETARRTEERQLPASYWVHLAPYATRKAAERRMKELARLGIRDMLIMQDAQGNYAISLGLFVQPDNARARIEELKQKGVEARQEVRERTESVVWFDLQLPEPADAAVTRLRSLDWGAGVELRDAECPVEVSR
jgi:hypothetical protein